MEGKDCELPGNVRESRVPHPNGHDAGGSASDWAADCAHTNLDACLRQAVAAGKVGLWDWNLQTNEVCYSAEWKRQIGYLDHEIRGGYEEWESRVHPEDLGPALEKILPLRDGSVTGFEVEFRLRHKDGSYRWIQAQGSIHEGADDMRHMVGTHVDITDRRREAELVQMQLDLASGLAAMRDRNEGLRLCVEIAIRASGLDCGGFYLVNQESGGLDLFAPCGISQEFIECVSRYAPGSDRARLILAGEPVYSCYADMGLEMTPPVKREGIRFLAVIPVKHEGRVIGSLNIGSHTVDEIQPIQRKMLETIAAQTGQAIVRLAAEAAAKESEARYRELVENSPMPIMAHQDGRFVFVNPAGLRLFGARLPDELVGRPVLDRVHPSFRDQVAGRIKAVETTGAGAPTLEEKLLKLDGTEIDVEVTASSFTHRGRPAVQIVLQDITERRRSERALADAFNLLQDVLENVPARVFWKDRESRYLGCNSAFAADAGLTSPEELIGKSDFEMGWREQAEAYRADDMTVMGSGMAKLGYEEQQTRPDGEQIWLRTSKVPLRAAGDGVVGVLGIYEDVTEYRRATAAVLREKQFFESLFQSIPGPAYVFGEDGRFIRWNRFFEEDLGYSAEQMSGEVAVMDVIHVEDREKVAEEIGRVFREGFGEIELRLQGTDQSIHPHYCVGALMESEGSRLLVGVGFDIAERLRAEAAVKDSEATLLDAQRLAEVGNWKWDILRDQHYWSDKVYEIYGRDPSLPAAVYPEVQQYFTPASWGDIVACVEKALVDGEPYECDAEVVRPDGSRRWITARGKAVLDDSGTVTSLSGTVQDITERKRAETALLEESQKNLTLLRNASDGIHILDEEARVVEASDSFCQMLGYEREEVIGMHVGQWDAMQTESELDDRLHAQLEKQERSQFETRHRRKDGSVFDVEVSGRPVEFGGRRLLFNSSRDITKTKRVMTDLARREEIFFNIINQATDATTVVEAGTGRFIEFNAAAHNGLGYSREEFAGLTVQDIQAEHSPEDIRTYNDRALRQGQLSFESRHRHRDGSLRDVRVSIRKLNGEGSDYLAAVWTDITELKKNAERERKEKLRVEFLLELHERAPQLSDKELYDQVLDRAVALTDSTIGFCHLVSEDQDTIILNTWNAEALKNCATEFETHYPLSQAGNWVDCVREQRPVVYNDFENSPNRWGMPEGHEPLRRFMSIPVIRDGKVRLIFGVGNKATDYTEDDVAQLQLVANELHKIKVQRAAQNGLRESEARLRSLVETSYDWVWELDAEGRYTYASPRVEALLGYEPEEVIGKKPFDLMPVTEARRLSEEFGGIVSRKEAFSGLENVNLHKSGREITLETSGVPILGLNGELLGYRGMDRDISERKRLETQLRQAQKLEAIGQLAGGVAHDFNNILAAVMMNLELMQENEELDAETREGLAELRDCTDRATSLTRQLLMFSRRSVLEIKTLDLNEVVDNLLKMLGRLLGEHIKLIFERSTSAVLVEADAGMLEQILMNLTVNARDAMPQGGSITISTSTIEFDDADLTVDSNRRVGRFASLAVTDTGSGMDAATLKHIFEPFFTTKEQGKGTGLGLATVHGIAAQHRGWVEVESTVGQGTTFRALMPVTSAVKEADTTEALRQVPRGTETLLVVEDELMVRKILARAMRGLGYHVLEAANGVEAIKQWRNHRDDVVLLFTDMVMPEGMTGLELAQRIRAEKPETKVIISSGYTSEINDVATLTKAGIVYLPKPYPMSEMGNILRTCLDTR